ncbi:MAG: amino acid permease [Rickettsiales endosymbiont of Dermacentor nuttalli]
MNLFRVKNILVQDVNSAYSLKKSLGALDILLMGIGAVIGTGVFVMTGVTAAQYTGPAIMLSFLFAGLSSIFVALAYIEIAAMVPTSGSVYNYAYISLGEVVAWVIGWNILLEYTVSATTIAAGWSGYIVGILEAVDIHLPKALIAVPAHGGFINIPAMVICFFVSMLLIFGTKESAKLNGVLVIVKLGAIFIFLVLSSPHFEVHNWDNFFPFGVQGVLIGAATIFFAFTGFDLLSTAAEECKNPKRDIVIGLIGSLLVCTLVYMLVGGMLTGIVSYNELNNAEPLAYAMRKNGSNIGSALVATGALAGMTTVLIVQLYAQSRLLFFMSRDGMLPPIFSKFHPKYKTPYLSNVIIGLIVSLIAGLTPIEIMGNLASTGTLMQYITVSIIVLYMRNKHPDVDRPFKCPYVYVIAPLAITLCVFLIYHLLSYATLVFIFWGILGLVIYFIYSYQNSRIY